MRHNYKNAMNKIEASGDFKDHLKSRLVREQARIDSCRPVVNSRWLKVFTSAVTAAVLLITAVSASIFLPDFLKRRTASHTETEYTVPTVETEVSQVPADMVVFSGNSSVCLAQNLSLRYISDDAINYNANIFFTFEGFEKYDVPLTGSCIVFETALAPSYTLSNFFEDYYNLIINGTGISTINNGVLESFFNIGDNGIRTFSVYDGERELIDLDTALMSEYKDMSNIHFTVSVS